MSRSLGVRLPDAQYDWLVERAIDNGGDMSEAVRDAIDAARILYDIVGARDPHGKLQALIAASEEEAGREAFFDEHGYYPGNPPDES